MSTSTEITFGNKSTEFERASDAEDLTYPWRDPTLLRELYFETGLNQSEIGEALGCSASTIGYQMRKHGMIVRDGNGSHYFADYEYYNDGNQTVGVHQLLACLDNDPHEVFATTNHVHHSNNHSADNRPSNLQVLSASVHKQTHNRNEWVDVDGERELRVVTEDGC